MGMVDDRWSRNSYANGMTYRQLYRACSCVVVGSASLTLAACAGGGGSRVELRQTQDGFALLKNGEAYTIYGVGGSSNLELLASYGGNTVRTWDAEGIGPMLDEAHALGISVVAGIWLEHQRHGFDYSDPESRQEQLDRVRMLVNEHKDHPALLAWGIGNEVELGGEMDVAIKQINDAAAVVKSLDPHHPRMAIIAEIGDDKAVRIQNECPDIDFIGINSYGGLGNLIPRLDAQGYTGAFAITEFGVVGHWETGNSPWGAPYEQSSSAKADFLKGNYAQTIEANLGTRCMGSFAFLWGHKQEKTETWYGLLLPTGETTESVDVLSTFWTGTAPENRAPRVTGLELIEADAAAIEPEQKLRVRVEAEDPDGDTLDVQWRVIPESQVQSAGGDFESGIAPVEVAVRRAGAKGALITMPKKPGAYRVFATVRDGKGHAGTINLPIYVVGDEAETKAE